MKKAIYTILLTAVLVPLTAQNSGEDYLKNEWNDQRKEILAIKEALSKEDISFQISEIPVKNRYLTVKSIEDIVERESGFDPFAVNKKSDAKGLMQITKTAWKEVNPKTPYETNWYKPKANLETGIKYLGWLERAISRNNSRWKHLSRKERTDQILAAYNWGYQNLKDAKWNLNEAPKETKRYLVFMNHKDKPHPVKHRKHQKYL